MSAITAAQRTIQTELVERRINQLRNGEPVSANEADLIIRTMVFDGVLHADWFLMVNSTIQLLKVRGFVK